MTEILNNDILELSSEIIQISPVSPIENLSTTLDILGSLKDTVNGIKDTVKDIKINVYCIIDTVLLCSTDASFTGPGGKNILNEEPCLAPGVKNTLTEKTKLEQKPILEQKTKEKEKQEIRTIQLRVTKRNIRGNAHPGGRDGVYNTILYEVVDRSSSTIISANTSYPIMRTTSALFGIPVGLRVGLAVEEVNRQGIPVEPVTSTWLVNNQAILGIECKALNQQGVIFTDKCNSLIIYR